MNNYTSKAIRKILENFGFEIYSIRKKKRMEGGIAYSFTNRLRNRSHRGTPYWFFQVELLSKPGVTTDDYELAVIVLNEAGYSQSNYGGYHGLRIELPTEEQFEHRMRLA